MQANKIDDLEVQVAVISALSERSGPLQVPGESTPTEEPLTLDDLTPLLDAKADGDYVEAQLDLKTFLEGLETRLGTKVEEGSRAERAGSSFCTRLHLRPVRCTRRDFPSSRRTSIRA